MFSSIGTHYFKVALKRIFAARYPLFMYRHFYLAQAETSFYKNATTTDDQPINQQPSQPSNQLITSQPSTNQSTNTQTNKQTASTNQPTNQLANHTINQSANQPTTHQTTTNYRTNQPLTKLTQPTHQPTNEWNESNSFWNHAFLNFLYLIWNQKSPIHKLLISICNYVLGMQVNVMNYLWFSYCFLNTNQ